MLHLALVSLLACLLEQAGGPPSPPITFTKDSAGKVPPGWHEDSTGKGKGSVWRVVADGTAPSGKGFVLAQTAQSPDTLFNLCVFQDAKAKDVEDTGAFQGSQGRSRSRRRPGLALSGFEELLRRPHESAGEQLPPVQGRGRQTHSDWNRPRISRCAGHLAHAQDSPRRHQITCYLDDKKHLKSRMTVFRRRQDRSVDQGRRRDLFRSVAMDQSGQEISCSRPRSTASQVLRVSHQKAAGTKWLWHSATTLVSLAQG